MRLITTLGIRKVGKRGYRFAKFECSSCGDYVDKMLKDGKNALFCSRECYTIERTNKKRGNYKVSIISNKYVYIYNPSHPYAIGTRKLYVAEHRLIMEKYIGRYLTKKEIVHHKNEDTVDNRLKNLQLMTNSDHIKLHAKLRKRKKDEKFKAN